MWETLPGREAHCETGKYPANAFPVKGFRRFCENGKRRIVFRIQNGGDHTLPILTIETTCDETAAAVIAEDGRVLGECVATQDSLHERFQGVVPEVAAGPTWSGFCR